ncbi:hypothetical protein XELAEV_18046450mg [Xenopus laevis]|uniref:Uncharacterized protein n=1 Tax=Xenopus laevis TaxID=8355 RepID=A0A974BTC6_XENLA|nr:hypothetical protein XELAEV_18046450mg [Xenopus laevis]
MFGIIGSSVIDEEHTAFSSGKTGSILYRPGHCLGLTLGKARKAGETDGNQPSKFVAHGHEQHCHPLLSATHHCSEH